MQALTISFVNINIILHTIKYNKIVFYSLLMNWYGKFGRFLCFIATFWHASQLSIVDFDDYRKTKMNLQILTVWLNVNEWASALWEGFVCLAARIISTAVKCFDDVKMNIRQRCRHEGAEIYRVHYIQPLVERTRDTVLTRCTLSAPYSAYFLQASGSSASPSLSFVSRPCFILLLSVFLLRLASSISAVAVSVWRHQLMNMQYARSTAGPLSTVSVCPQVRRRFKPWLHVK